MDKRTINAVTRTKQFKQLIEAGLQLASTDRQLANGTIKLTGKFKSGRKTIRPVFAVTAAGAVISNEFVARRVDPNLVGSVDAYRQGFSAVSEILQKRLTA